MAAIFSIVDVAAEDFSNNYLSLGDVVGKAWGEGKKHIINLTYVSNDDKL